MYILWMNGCMYILWMNRCIYFCIDGCMDVRIYRCIYYGCMDVYIMDEWIYVCMMYVCMDVCIMYV